MRLKEMTVITGDINSSYGSSLRRRPFFPRQVVVAGCKTAGLPHEEGHAEGPVGLCACLAQEKFLVFIQNKLLYMS